MLISVRPAARQFLPERDRTKNWGKGQNGGQVALVACRRASVHTRTCTRAGYVQWEQYSVDW